MTNAYRSLRITIESKMRHGSRANAHTDPLSVKSNSISGEMPEGENIYYDKVALIRMETKR